MSFAAKLPRPFKPILTLLGTDVVALAGRARRPVPERRQGPEPVPQAKPDAWMREPSLRLMEVLSALPPVQVPDWFKQRFESNPLFELQELQELTPGQRQQLIVLVEKTLDSRRGAWSDDRPSKEALASFLEQARRQDGK